MKSFFPHIYGMFGQEWDAGYQKGIIFLMQEMVSVYSKLPSGIITRLKLW